MNKRFLVLMAFFAVLFLSNVTFGEMLAKSSFTLTNGNPGASPNFDIRGASQVRVGVRFTAQYGFTAANFSINGTPTGGHELFLGNYSLPDGKDSSFTVLVESPADYTRIVGKGTGVANNPITVEVFIWGEKPYEPVTAEISSGGSKVNQTPIISPLIDLGAFYQIRVAYDASRTAGATPIKPPTVTVIGVFNGVEIPIEKIQSTGDLQRGGSVMLMTPPDNIKLKFTNNESGSGSEIQVRWFVWGIRKNLINP